MAAAVDGSSEDGESEPVDGWSLPPSPAPWAVWVARGLDGLTALVLALIVMEQWMVWFAVTMDLWRPWSVVLGIAVASAQILMMFSRARAPTCEDPRSNDPSF